MRHQPALQWTLQDLGDGFALPVGPRRVSLLGTVKTSEKPHQFEAFVAARPIPPQHVRTSTTHHSAQHQTDRDQIVRIAQDRNEVRDKIDRRGQIREQDAQSDPHASRRLRISGETAEQANNIGHEPLRRTKVHATRTRQRKHGHEQEPGQHQRDNDQNEQFHKPIVSPPQAPTTSCFNPRSRSGRDPAPAARNHAVQRQSQPSENGTYAIGEALENVLSSMTPLDGVES
jgi:hypothetical protein